MLRKATPDAIEIVWRRRALLREVDAHPADNALAGVDRGQPVARRIHQRQKPLVAVGHLLRQVLERVGVANRLLAAVQRPPAPVLTRSHAEAATSAALSPIASPLGAACPTTACRHQDHQRSGSAT